MWATLGLTNVGEIGIALFSSLVGYGLLKLRGAYAWLVVFSLSALVAVFGIWAALSLSFLADGLPLACWLVAVNAFGWHPLARLHFRKRLPLTARIDRYSDVSGALTATFDAHGQGAVILPTPWESIKRQVKRWWSARSICSADQCSGA